MANHRFHNIGLYKPIHPSLLHLQHIQYHCRLHPVEEGANKTSHPDSLDDLPGSGLCRVGVETPLWLCIPSIRSYE
jgi:hypothetical protein